MRRNKSRSPPHGKNIIWEKIAIITASAFIIFGVFGSQEECRRICADNAILMIYFELNRIIDYLALITEILCIIFNERTRLIFPM